MAMNADQQRSASPEPGATPNGGARALLVADHELVRRIGRGSYGEVWLARSTTGAYRAVKVVCRPDGEENGGYDREFNGVRSYEPFSREHEAVVDVLHVGHAGDGRCFCYIMELADDVEASQTIDPARYEPRTLRTELRRRGRLPVAECLEIATALASALEHLHRNGLVHRDVKPSNIIFISGRPKLADVGLVTATAGSDSFVGTMGYVAPEGPRGPPSDIYSLGKVLYEISTGKDRHQYPELPTDLKDQPDYEARVRFSGLIVRACDEDPRHRYQTASDLLGDLGRLRAGQVLPRRSVGRSGWLLARALLAILTVTTLLGWQYGRKARLRPGRSISLPGVPDWTGTQLTDWDNDGETELFVAQEGRLWVVSAEGEPAKPWQPGQHPAEDLAVQIINGPTGVGGGRAFMSWRAGPRLNLSALGSGFHAIEDFTAPAITVTHTNGWSSSNRLRAARLVDLEGDGRLELLATMGMGYGGHPRGVWCFAYGQRQPTPLWTFECAPNVSQVECLDANGTGQRQIVLGMEAPDNDARMPDGTDDAHTYLVILSPRGELLKQWELWDRYSQSHVIIDPTNRAFYVWSSYSGSDLRDREGLPRQGEVIKFDYDGNPGPRFPSGAYLHSCALVDRHADGRRELLLSDADGWLHVLSLDLERVGGAKVFPGRKGCLRPNLIAAVDLIGDAAPELVFRVGEEEHVVGDNPGRPDQAAIVRFYQAPSVVVLDSAFRRIASHAIAERLKYRSPPPVWVGRLKHEAPPRVLVFSDRVTIMDLAPPWGSRRPGAD
jgi:hypothetical protein